MTRFVTLRRLAAIALAVCASAPAPAQPKADARGAILFVQCRACHSLKAGEPNKVGPNLARLFARAPASAVGFRYSSAFVASKIRWTPAMLDRWLERPSQLVPGTTMAFGGMSRSEDRAALVAWLQANTR